jgi:hypothetical protein
MVTSAELDRLQRLNFGLRMLQERVTPDAIARELGRYDPQDAALGSQQRRATAGRDAAVASVIALYKDVIEAHRQDGAYDPRLDLQAVPSRHPILPPSPYPHLLFSHWPTVAGLIAHASEIPFLHCHFSALSVCRGCQIIDITHLFRSY